MLFLFIELLKQMLDLNEKRVIAESKTAFTDASKEQIKAQAQIDLLKRPEYREVYKRVYGFDPGGTSGIFNYDMKTKTYR